jgi:hypothetical protein
LYVLLFVIPQRYTVALAVACPDRPSVKLMPDFRRLQRYLNEFEYHFNERYSTKQFENCVASDVLDQAAEP